jgi:hypothetical protein
MWADNGPVTFNAASPEKKPEDKRPPSQKWDPPVVSGVLYMLVIGETTSRTTREIFASNLSKPTQPNLT